MKKLLLMMSVVVLISGCEEKESPEITRIKETNFYYECVMRQSFDLRSITPTMEKMIQKKCIDKYQK